MICSSLNAAARYLYSACNDHLGQRTCGAQEIPPNRPHTIESSNHRNDVSSWGVREFALHNVVERRLTFFVKTYSRMRNPGLLKPLKQVRRLHSLRPHVLESEWHRGLPGQMIPTTHKMSLPSGAAGSTETAEAVFENGSGVTM